MLLLLFKFLYLLNIIINSYFYEYSFDFVTFFPMNFRFIMISIDLIDISMILLLPEKYNGSYICVTETLHLRCFRAFWSGDESVNLTWKVRQTKILKYYFLVIVVVWFCLVFAINNCLPIQCCVFDITLDGVVFAAFF